MKIALIGYGKMGKTIEEIAVQRGHSIVLRIDIDNQQELTAQNLSNSDVAVEFTGPQSAFENIKKCISFGVPVVCGSTGWTEKLDDIKNIAVEKSCGFLYASNFSVGVNIFFELNKKLAALMEQHPDYEIQIEEIHHTQKKDSPSGTAITIAEQILEKISRKQNWLNQISENPLELEIISKRVDPTPGTHKVRYSSAVDDIEIMHIAHNRQGFALGAVMAAEFIHNKKGVYSMREVLNL